MASYSTLGTGTVTFSILNDLTVEEAGEYKVTFADSIQQSNRQVRAKNYTVLNVNPVSEVFTPFDTMFTALGHSNIADDSFLKVTGSDGTVYSSAADYVVNFQRGSIRRTAGSRMPNNGQFTVNYRYYPVFQSQQLQFEDGNPVFEGIVLRIQDEATLAYDTTKSRWIEGKTNYLFTARAATIGSRKMIWPADYEIRFASQDIDTAVTVSGGLVRIPVNYSVKEVTHGTPQPILSLLIENPATRDRKWSPGEEIVLFQPGARGVSTDTTTWSVIVFRPIDTTITPVLPTDGDVLLIKTRRPFNAQDAFALKTQAGKMNVATAASRLDNIYVVPNPYVGLSSIEPANSLPGQSRGERRLYFENLPPKCTIRIFTVSGDHVQTLTHESGLDNGREYWNLLNTDGFSVAYGVYIAHIDAPGIGETIIKLAIIK